jgi:hypothetical protein
MTIDLSPRRIIAAMALTVIGGVLAHATDPDSSTLNGKVVCGYQGWFEAPGDGNPASVGWRHWSRDTDNIGPGLYTVEMWPDVSEYNPADLFTAAGVTLQDSTTGKLFSSVRPGVVDLHFEWMQDYGIDGVFLQRFVSELGDPRFFDIRNTVLDNVRTAANAHGRVFALEYDTSGTSPANMLTAMSQDWEYLVDNTGLLSDPRYLHQNGKPVVIIWGLGFEGRGHTPAMAQQVIDYFKDDPIYGGNYVIGGVPTFWRTRTNDSETDPGWTSVYHSFDAINPWMVGRVNNQSDIDNFATNVWQPDLTETSGLGKDYMPVVFPGFSWDNLMQLPPGTSLIPRQGGQFLWDQIYKWKGLGAGMMFVAMFDEVDEGTAIFKVSPNHPVTDHWVDYGSYPTDWYLKLVSEGSKMLRGDIALTSSIPVDSDGDSIPDVVEGFGDTDNDTIPNYLDTDSDGDTIPDAAEGTADPDHDGMPNFLDTDSDGDTLSDAAEGTGDVDLDTIPNYIDADSDNDGVMDSIEVSLGTDPYDPFDVPAIPLYPWPLAVALLAAGMAIYTSKRKLTQAR